MSVLCSTNWAKHRACRLVQRRPLHPLIYKKRVTPKNDSFNVVPPGIEPGTQGFSVLCSTNWAMAPLCFLLSECKGRHFKFTVQLFCRFLCKISANNQQSPRKPTKKASFWERHAQEGGTIKVVYQNASNSYLLFGRILQGFPSALFIPPLFIRFARCALVRRSCLVTSSFWSALRLYDPPESWK